MIRGNDFLTARSSLVESLLRGWTTLVFLSCGILSARLVYVTLCRSEPVEILLLSIMVIGLAGITLARPVSGLHTLVAVCPLISGIQVLSLLPRKEDWVAVGFAAVYLAWLLRRVGLDKLGIVARSSSALLVDLLAGLTVLSLVMVVRPYALSIVLYRAFVYPTAGLDDPFYSMSAAFTLLCGLLLYRLLELELGSEGVSNRRAAARILSVHAVTIVVFSLFQLVARTPPLRAGIGVYAPFPDIHSYGSYVGLLVLFFLGGLTRPGGGLDKERLALGVLLVGCLAVSTSRSSWLAVLVVGMAWLLRRKKAHGLLIALGLAGVLVFVNLLSFRAPGGDQSYLRRLLDLVLVDRAAVSMPLRLTLWERAATMAFNQPLTGHGVGTFQADSAAYTTDEAFAHEARNSHGYFLQLAAELGAPSLLILLGVVGLALRPAESDRQAELRATRGLRLGIGAYLLTCLTGHPLLVAAQQVLFWFAVHHILAGPSEKTVTGQGYGRGSSPWIVGLALLSVGLGYGLCGERNRWLLSRREYGLYRPERLDGETLRWTMGRAVWTARPEGPVVSMDMRASAYGVADEGLLVSIDVDGKPWDQITFCAEGRRTLDYFEPDWMHRLVEFRLATSRTFNPYRLGLGSDDRELGVALPVFSWKEELPEDGVGFHNWEVWHGEPLPGWPQGEPARFRWTGRKAALKLSGDLQEVDLLLKCLQPDVARHPVEVLVSEGKDRRVELTFSDQDWKVLGLGRAGNHEERVIRIEVSRTWNPWRAGVSEDCRDLGVAVALRAARR